MSTVNLKYDTWNDHTDKLLERPGSMLGYVAIKNGLDVGDTPTIRGRKRDDLIHGTEDGVIGLIAGGLEWLRKRGLTASEVENLVQAYISNNQQSYRELFLREKKHIRATQLVSSP